MRTDDLDYTLPPERIATEPASPRDTAKLMVAHRATGRIEHCRVRDLPEILQATRPAGTEDLLVFNQTRVLPAYFRGQRLGTGGKVTGLFVALATTVQGQPTHGAACWEVMLESRGLLRVGERIGLEADSHLELTESLGSGQWRARLHSPHATLDLLQRVGVTPLPPYIRRQRRAHGQQEVQAQDAVTYNTVYARDPGSVAAPTAGLHFTPELLAQLDQSGCRRSTLTLHVGLGTFAPVRTERLEEHPIHREWIDVPAGTITAVRAARAGGSRIIVVGTTTVRALESLPEPLPHAIQGYQTDTQLFIMPGFVFRYTDVLMTNFHLPKSTLLALVAALPGVGIDRLKDWYGQAIAAGYRFYSYGDAMIVV